MFEVFDSEDCDLFVVDDDDESGEEREEDLQSKSVEIMMLILESQVLLIKCLVCQTTQPRLDKSSSREHENNCNQITSERESNVMMK